MYFMLQSSIVAIKLTFYLFRSYTPQRHDYVFNLIQEIIKYKCINNFKFYSQTFIYFVYNLNYYKCKFN